MKATDFRLNISQLNRCSKIGRPRSMSFIHQAQIPLFYRHIHLSKFAFARVLLFDNQSDICTGVPSTFFYFSGYRVLLAIPFEWMKSALISFRVEKITRIYLKSYKSHPVQYSTLKLAWKNIP